MTEPIDPNSPFWHTDFPAYYDINTAAVERGAAALRELEGDQRERGLRDIATGITAHVHRFDAGLLPQVAVSMTDDLYVLGCTIGMWDPALSDYVGAVWRTFYEILAERGYLVRYLVDNTWPDGLMRPLQLFPVMFQDAGLLYVCPHELATRLPEAAGTDHTVEGLTPLIAEGRHLATRLVQRAAAEHRSFLYLEVDYQPGALDHVMELPAAPGSITVLRNQPGLPGTTVRVRTEPLA